MNHFYESCALCGPKSIKSDCIAPMLVNLDLELGLLISQNVTSFRVIPSPGFNSYAALSVLNLKRLFPEAELEVIVGNFNQNLSDTDAAVRDFIISHADRIIDTEKLRGSESIANILTDSCSYLVCYGDHDPGFSFTVHECAATRGLQIIPTQKTNVPVSA